MSGYTEAWRDAGSMVDQKLPVLPHKAQELERAGKALDEQRPHGATDLSAALRQTPKLDADRAIGAMNAAASTRVGGKERDIAKKIGLPPPNRDRTRDRGLKR